MTKFRRINLEKSNDKKCPKKTVFNNYVTSYLNIASAKIPPDDYEVVIHIGMDRQYGDVFVAYNDDPNKFFIYFGEAGDEFENNGE